MGFNSRDLQRIVEGQGSPLENLINDSNYGVPKCLLELGEKALGLLPFDVLTALRVGALQGKVNAENDINSFLDDLRDSLGISDLFDENGQLKFLSNWSSGGLELIKTLGSAVGYIDGILAYGQSLYRTGQDIYNEFNKIKECFKSLKSNYVAKYPSISDRELALRCLEKLFSKKFL